VASKVKITMPRIELVAANNSARLDKTVIESLRISLKGVRYFTKSSAIIGILRMESGRFNEFVGAQVSKVKVNSKLEKERLWLM
jgi:hypothetical protein